MIAFFRPDRVNYARLFKLVVLPNVAFFVGALFLTGPQMIAVLNAALVALAAGVVISFVVDALRTLASHKPLRKVHWLALGITTHWAGTVGTRLWSMLWRWLGQPAWLADSRFVAYCLFLSAIGAYFHLASSEAIGDERIPRAKWVRYGVIAAASIIAFMLVGYAFDRWAALELTTAFG